MSWQIYQTNQFFGRIVQGKVIKNDKHIPAIYNIDRANANKEDQTIMQILKNNSIKASAWHQANKFFLNELDQIELKQINESYLVDSLWKALQHENNNEYVNRCLQFKELFLGFDYDGLIYSTNNNIAHYNQKRYPQCQYQGYFPPDIRCIYNFSQINVNNSVVAFNPEVFTLNGSQQVTQTFCQRLLMFSNIDQELEKYSVLCLKLDLGQISLYFGNYGQNSKIQILLSSEYQSVIYNSLFKQIKLPQLLNIQQFGTQYLQDENSTFNFLQQIQSKQQFIIESLNQINIFGFNRKNEQYLFNYSRNNTDYYVIQNLITIVGKIPSFNYSEQSANSSKKYQIIHVFMLLDIVSDEKIVSFSENLKNRINEYNIIFLVISLIIALIILILQSLYSYHFVKSILDPITHLTDILNENFHQNMQNNKQDKSNNQYLRSQRLFNSKNDKEKNQLYDDKLQIDDCIQNYIKENFLSFEILELFSSLQYLFKFLRFTTINTFKEDPSLNLINLSLEIKHFEQFKNNRALGVCYNNIGVIHYNSGRFKESIENFEKSIIYAKYELDFYTHENSNKSNYNFSLCEKTEQKFLQFQQSEGLQNKYKSQRDFGEKSDMNKLFIDQEKQQLYWSLYNRMQNQVKAIGSYIYQNQCFSLSEDFYQIIKQMIQVSNQHLPLSTKRDMVNYYIKLVSFKMQNNYEESFNILENFINLYTQKFEQKKSQSSIQKAESLQKNSIFIQKNKQLLTNNQTQNDQQINYKSFVYQNNTFNILMSPIQSNKLNILRKQWRSQFQKQFHLLRLKIQKSKKSNKNKYQRYKRLCTNKQDMPENNKWGNQQVKKSGKEFIDKYIPYFQVRKHKTQEKLCSYLYSSDIFFSYYALEQANFQIKLQNYQSACMILTNHFENSIYYLPHLRMQALNTLTQIFKINKIPNPQLYEITRKAQTLPHSNVNVCVLSACQSTYSQLRSYAVQSDLINEILFKDKDQFCLSIYSFEEQQFFQQIQFTKIQILKSNQKLFSKLIKKQVIVKQSSEEQAFQKSKQKFQENIQVEFNDQCDSDQNKQLLQRNTLQEQINSQVELCLISKQKGFQDETVENNLIARSYLKQVNQEMQKSQELSTEEIHKKQINSTKLPHLISQINSFIFSPSNLLQKYDFTDKKLDQKMKNANKNKSDKYQKNQKKNFNNQLNLSPNKNQIKYSQMLQRFSKILDSPRLASILGGSNSFMNHLQFNSQVESTKNENSQQNNEYNQIFSQESLITQSPALFNNNLTNSQYIFFKKTKNNLNASQEDNKNNFDYAQQNYNFIQNQPSINESSSYLQDIFNKKSLNQRSKQNKSGETIFHIGIQAAFKQFILNSNEKLSCYLSQKKFMSQGDISEQSSEIKNKTYLIYITDQLLEFQNWKLFSEMCQIINNLNIEILILNLNKKNQLQEQPEFNNVYMNLKSIITFFSTEEKLLQYISDSTGLVGFDAQYLTTFEYKYQNRTKYFFIQNFVTVIDKIPSFDILKSMDPSQKFQKINTFVVLNVRSNERMAQYVSNLKSKIIFYNLILFICGIGAFVGLVSFQTYFSLKFGKSVLQSIVYLTNLIKEIYEQSQASENQYQYNQSQRNILPNETNDQNLSQENYGPSVNKIKIDEHFFYSFKEFSFSSFYSFDSVQAQFTKSIQLGASILKRSMAQNSLKNSKQINKEFMNIRQISLQNNFFQGKQIQSQINSDKDQLYWNLFNRNLNFLKAFNSFITNSKQSGLLEIFSEVSLQNTSLSQIYLPHSSKRQMFNYCSIITSYFNQNQFEEAKIILDYLKHTYIKNLKNKTQNINIQSYKPINNDIEFSYQEKAQKQQDRKNIIFFSTELQDSNLSNNIFPQDLKNYFQNDQDLKQSNFLKFQSYSGQYKNIQITQKIQNLDDYQDYLKKLINQSNNRYQNSEQFKDFTFYQVRKQNDSLKITRYEFSSDIYFQYYSLYEAQYLIQQNDYYHAVLILNNGLENCKYYLPHLKKQVIQSLRNIFLKNKLFSNEFEDFKDKYDFVIHCNIGVYTVVACKDQYFNKKAYGLINYLVNDILYKQDNKFGVIQYCFSEKMFYQLVSVTNIKIYKSNPRLFDVIYKNILIQNTIQKQQPIVKSISVQYDRNKIKRTTSIFQTSKFKKHQTYQESSLINQSQQFSVNKCQNTPYKKSFQLQRENSCDIQNLNLIQQKQCKLRLQDKLEMSKSISSQNYLQRPSKKSQQDYCNYKQINSTYYELNYSSQNEEDSKKASFLQDKQIDHLKATNINNTNQINKQEKYQEVGLFSKDQEQFNFMQLKSEECEDIYSENADKDLDEIYPLFHNQINRNIVCHQHKTQEIKEEIDRTSYNSFRLNNCQPMSQKFKIFSQSQYYDDVLDNKEQQKTQNIFCLYKKPQNEYFQKHSKIKNYYLNREIAQNQNNKLNQAENSELIFHLGVQAAIKQFILDTNNKITLYVSQKKQNKTIHLQKQKRQIKQKYKYLIFITDQQLKFSNNLLIQDLCQLLINLDKELLLLIQNEAQSLEEFSEHDNIFINSKIVISFFNREEKLQQYIYNQREHVKNYQYPMIYEYF
ncbi:hypothetical protein ABPG72_018217 [Tetrahymena utriculariae]